MFVLRLGEVHEDDCEALSTTNDWLPLDDFSNDSLEGMELRCCPSCIDGPNGPVSVSELTNSERRETTGERTAAPSQ